MKTLLIALIILGSMSAFVHPDDSDAVSKIPVGSKITFLRSINIKTGKLWINPDAAGARFAYGKRNDNVRLTPFRSSLGV